MAKAKNNLASGGKLRLEVTLWKALDAAEYKDVSNKYARPGHDKHLLGELRDTLLPKFIPGGVRVAPSSMPEVAT